MPFSELIGQERALHPLRAALRRGALHHAYLFAGPAGVGKGTAARLLAQAANCERPAMSVPPPGQPEGTGLERAEGSVRSPASVCDDTCGACGPCRKIARGVHPDVVLVAEERAMARAGTWEPRGGRSPSKDIVVDQIRELVDRRLSLRRLEARRRFVVLDPADAMNPQAQNALLKTLEEPPEHTTLVLVSAAADSLLPTVRSRCLRVAFAPLPPERVEERLRAAGRSPEAARLAAELSGGSLGRALDLDAETMAERRRAVEEAASLDPDDARAWIAFARRWGADRDGARETCELLWLWLRDVLARAVAGERAALALADLGPQTAGAAARLSAPEVLRRGERVRQAVRALRQNSSPPLALERMLVGWFHG